MQRRGGRVPSGHHLSSRLRPVEVDPLAEYGLPSKGEKRLLSAKTQETFYSKIAERYLAFCTEAGDSDGLQKQFARLAIDSNNKSVPAPTTRPNTTTTTTERIQKTDLSQILMALRKLREAIVASKRRDDFATQVYLFAIRLGILSSSHETYHPALLYLLKVIHPAHNLSSVELQEVVGYLVLDAACRRSDLAEAYTLRNKYRLKDPKVDAVLRALSRDDWVLWRKVRRSVDGHKARIMDFAEPQLRSHILKAFGRSYLSVSREFLETQTFSSWSELVDRHQVGWELDNGRVVIRKIQGRS
ncbi:hypothetical protein QBC46DRAFT_378005 [Diplogelasinospora grovesii]|uniref:CSN8/PSMD8/EIF3K domain-containing protein n=1 Tax=Diplogelasinospora grovesii TaxID=303347 RepID=A0AAN6NED1_9PEZI|nr:hypothetical protein QBC46DRAFT_378005 [Diplogelasinospora grovesii]